MIVNTGILVEASKVNIGSTLTQHPGRRESLD